MIDLVQIIEEWIPTSGFQKLVIAHVDPAYFKDAGNPRAWLNYQNYPTNWYCNIMDTKIHVFHHSTSLEILAGDPEFFEKLSELIRHVIVSNNCDLCKAEIASCYTNYD